MCGDIPDGHTARDVTLVFSKDQTNVRFGLPYQFHNVVEVRVREVFVNAPNFSMGRLKFNNDAVEHEACNAVGEGFVFACRQKDISHTVYTNPRKISDRSKAIVTDVFCTLTGLRGNDVLIAPNYTEAYFVLTFIMRDERYDAAATFQQRQEDPSTAKGQFSTRAPWMKQ